MQFFSKVKPNQRKLTKEDRLLAENIQRLRRKRDISQEELSTKLGFSASYIAFIETGRRGTTLPVLYKLAKIFDIKLKDLFDF